MLPNFVDRVSFFVDAYMVDLIILYRAHSNIHTYMRCFDKCGNFKPSLDNKVKFDHLKGRRAEVTIAKLRVLRFINVFEIDFLRVTDIIAYYRDTNAETS